MLPAKRLAGWFFLFAGTALGTYNRGLTAGVAQLVERNLAKVEVASSRLVSRSSFCVQGIFSRPKKIRASLNGPFFHPRRDGRVVMQRPAKPCTSVRFRVPPPLLILNVA